MQCIKKSKFAVLNLWVQVALQRHYGRAPQADLELARQNVLNFYKRLRDEIAIVDMLRGVQYYDHDVHFQAESYALSQVEDFEADAENLGFDWPYSVKLLNFAKV